MICINEEKKQDFIYGLATAVSKKDLGTDYESFYCKEICKNKCERSKK